MKKKRDPFVRLGNFIALGLLTFGIFHVVFMRTPPRWQYFALWFVPLVLEWLADRKKTIPAEAESLTFGIPPQDDPDAALESARKIQAGNLRLRRFKHCFYLLAVGSSLAITHHIFRLINSTEAEALNVINGNFFERRIGGSLAESFILFISWLRKAEVLSTLIGILFILWKLRWLRADCKVRGRDFQLSVYTVIAFNIMSYFAVMAILFLLFPQ